MSDRVEAVQRLIDSIREKQELNTTAEVVEYILFELSDASRNARIGRALGLNSCKSTLYHGPGHQSRTTCELWGEHDVHEARFGEFDQFASWRGNEAVSGVFDEAPTVDGY